MREDVKSEYVYQTVFESSSEGIVTLDHEGIVTSANPAALSLFKMEELPENMKIVDIDVIEKESVRNLLQLFMERKEKVGGMDRDLRIVYKDGEERWIRLCSNENRDGSDKNIGYIVLLRDITNEVKKDRELEKSAHRFEMLVERLREGIFITDLDDNIKYANRALGKLFGTNPEQLRGRNISSLVRGEDLEKMRSRPHSKEPMEGDHEIRIRTAEGKKKDLLVYAGPWTDENGEVLGTMGLVLDITRLKRSERKLRLSSEKYRATVEQSAENIYIYDIDSRKIVEANQTLRNLLGYTPEEMEGLEPTDFIAHSREDVKQKIEEVIGKGKAIVGERTYIRKDGTPVEVEVSASLIMEGDRPMLCVVSRDVTERKKARKQLVEERNRAEFYLDLLAHDMGNIHHGMIAGLDLYEMYQEPEKKEMAVNKVRELLNRSLRLAYNVKTYTKLRSSTPILKRIDLSEAVNKGYEAAVSSFPDKDVEHIMEWDREDHMVWAEPLMEEIFYNIYHNALKYQSKNPAFLDTRVKGMDNGRIRIEIGDKGKGIPDSVKKQIFDRSREPCGMQHSGLGLVIIDTLMDRYKGKIWIENRVKEDHTKGSIFKMEFPGAE